MSIIGSELLLASAAATGYQVERSLRFNSSDSAYLSRTPASAGNRKTWTWAGWVKRGALGTNQNIFGTNSSTGLYFLFQPDNTFVVQDYTGSVQNYALFTSQVFRDPSAWLHVLFALDTTQATASDRIKLYINGVQVTTFSTRINPSLNYNGVVNTATTHTLGRLDIQYYFDGYLADVHFIDGQALDPSSFTEVSATTGQLIPKAYTGTFTGNSFWLKFADNSAATATTLGKDSSGLGNNWTPNNLSVTAGAGNDSLVDTPTSYGTDTGAGGEVRGNYATLNPLDTAGGSAFSCTNGNLDGTFTNTGATAIIAGTVYVSSGKWYAEFTPTVIGSNAPSTRIGVQKNVMPRTYLGGDSTNYAYRSNGEKQSAGSSVAYGSTYTTGDVIGIGLNMDAGTITFYKNGVSQGQAYSGLSGEYTFAYTDFGNGAFNANFGQRPFAYTAPSGFKALCDTNLPAPVVAKSSTAMDVKLYTGNGSTQTISGLNFSPDMVWIKCRSAARDHQLQDIVRGATKELRPNKIDLETTEPNGITAFTSDGFSLAGNSNYNVNAGTFVAWCWDAGSSTVTNTAGSITSQVRASTSSGFSVVTYTGNGTGGATVGHGGLVNLANGMIIVKRRDSSVNWFVGHGSQGWTKVFEGLNTTASISTTSSAWNNTSPTSTVFTLGTETSINGSGGTFVAYCFAPVDGYSSFGSYTGNGSTDGPFVYTGFRPAFVMIKRTDTTGDWIILDDKRLGYNADNYRLFANLTNGDNATVVADLTSNGFKLRTASVPTLNASGGSYIYAAWASAPFAYSRAR